MNELWRSIKPLEMEILDQMLDLNLPQIFSLKTQIAVARVRTVDTNGSIEFWIPDGLRASLPDGPIVNGHQTDNDTVPNVGPYINYILFARDGLVRELQIYKDGALPFVASRTSGNFTTIYPDRRLATFKK